MSYGGPGDAGDHGGHPRKVHHLLPTLFALVSPDRQGWIGRWSPGLGDPTAAGWTTVVLYVAAAGLCASLARRVAPAREATLWRALAVAFLLLGVNKQLDLESAVAEIGRIVASKEGWYARRRPAQALLVAALFGTAMVAAAKMWAAARRAPPPSRVAATAAVLLIAFVVIRATSFHYVDALVRLRLVGLRSNWIFEMGGILVVIAAAARRAYGLGRLG